MTADPDFTASIRAALAQMQEQKAKLTGAIEALQRVLVMYEPATGAARAYTVEERTSDTGASARVKTKIPCEECGTPYPEGTGMSAHTRWHARQATKAGLSPGAGLVPRILSELEPALKDSGQARSDPDLETEPAPAIPCMFCEVNFSSDEARQAHQWTCPKRLETRASTLHVHTWKLDSPKGGFSKGTCKACGANQDFPEESGVSWNDKNVKKRVDV